MEKELELEKESINKFLSLSKFFKFFKKDHLDIAKIKDNNQSQQLLKNGEVELEISEEKQQLIKKFNQFFELDKTFYWLEMLKNGYKPNVIQEQKVQEFMSKALKQDHGLYVEYLLHVGFQLSLRDKEEYLKKVILHKVNANSLGEKKLTLDFFMKGDNIMSSSHHAEFGIRLEKEEKLPLLTAILKNFINNESPNFGKKLFNELTENILSDINRSNSAKVIINILNEREKSYLLKDVSFDELFDFRYKLKEQERQFNLQDLIIQIDRVLHFDYQDGYSKILEKTKQEYAENYIKVITVNSIIEDTKIITVTNLPTSAKDIIKEINDLYKNINSSSETVSEDERFVLTNLIEVRIPEVLKKYLVLDNEFKTTFKNAQNQNAEEVMLQSLSDFKTRFDKTWREINELRFSSLNASGKYAKAIKTM